MNRVTTAGLACAVLLLAGCSGGDGDSADAPGPGVATLPSSGTQLLVGGPVAEEDRGDTTFQLRPVVVNGCLGGTTGERTFLVVWPSDIALADTDSDELEHDGQVLSADGSFTGTGTMVFSQPFPESFPDIPIRCLGPNTEPVVWLQEIDEISE